MNDAQGSFLTLMQRSQDLRLSAVDALKAGDLQLAGRMLSKSKNLDEHLIEVLALLQGTGV